MTHRPFEPNDLPLARNVASTLRRRRISDHLEAWPSLYRCLMATRLKQRGFDHWVVSRQTALTIEGFPRSATSFAIEAAKKANPYLTQAGQLATHIHSPTQAILSVRWNIPCLILIRQPRPAVCSTIALGYQVGLLTDAMVEKDMNQLIAYWLHRYSMFYNRLRPVAHKIVTATFDQTIKDFGIVFDRLNSFYGTDFTRFNHSLENERGILDTAKIHLGPNEQRNQLKAKLDALYLTPTHLASRIKAEKAHEEYLNAADAHALSDATSHTGTPRNAGNCP